jgi:phosphoenolpyruvate carboxykinase (ATP)
MANRERSNRNEDEHVEPSRQYWNLDTGELYIHANEQFLSGIQKGRILTDKNGAPGALDVETDIRGRSPEDKFIVSDEITEHLIDWGKTNKRFSPEDYDDVRSKIIDYLTDKQTYIQDLYIGRNPEYRRHVRIVSELAYHALFAKNLFIRPLNPKELESSNPDLILYNAANLKLDPQTDHTRSSTGIFLNLSQGEFLIAGTQYAGEIKKAIFSAMNYYLPQQDVLPLHCSCNYGPEGDVALFCGLSGTGKTSLSADSKRILIGDDEHGLSDQGTFNLEGGCYAKVVRLSKENEPEIYDATNRYGTVLENVVVDITGEPDFDDDSLTENTRAAYPIEFIANADPEGLAGTPRNLILLTCDANGVLPPISRLTPEQAEFHFLSGYTAKIPGTERGITEPQVTFSACYGGPFMPLHPTVYAEMLEKKIRKYGINCWLLNTGWTGGPYGEGKRISIKDTKAMRDAILAGHLDGISYVQSGVMGLEVPAFCPGIDGTILIPQNTWEDPAAYVEAAQRLEQQFAKNYEKFT